MGNASEWWEATKKMLLPFAALASILFTIVIFAGEQWVRNIARDEIAQGAGTSASSKVQEHETRLTRVEGTVDDHADEIDETEEDVKELDSRFQDFIQRIIDKL